MSHPADSRRSFMKKSFAASSALAAMTIPRSVHAAGVDETLKIGLIGCGGRGTGAALDALAADKNAKLVAIADTFKDRAEGGLEQMLLDETLAERITVTPETTFSGFDAYQKVVDSDVDVVILATPPHFRPQHLKYVVDKGKHCFVEKPIAVDIPGVKSVEATCELARQKGLVIVSGLCWRYEPGVQETIKRIHDGAIGDIVAIESSYNTSTLWHRGDDPTWSRMEYQIRNWPYYTWLSGDHIVEQAIHSVDKTLWAQGDPTPLRAFALGGRQQRTGSKWGHIFDHFAVYYEYASGVRVSLSTRQQDNCSMAVDEHVLGTKGRAQILANKIDGETKWKYEGPKPNMYRSEHEAMFKAIRAGEKIDDSHYMCNSTQVAIMGRLAAYTGQTLTWDQINSSQEKLGPTGYDWTDLPEPPVAIPGFTKFV